MCISILTVPLLLLPAPSNSPASPAPSLETLDPQRVTSIPDLAEFTAEWEELRYGTPPPYAYPRPSGLAKSLSPASEADGDDGYDFSYTYVQAGYFSNSGDFTDGSSNAWGLNASIGLFGFLRAFGGYTSDSASVSGGGNLDTDSYFLGVGGYMSVMPRLDLVADITWIYDDLSSDTLTNLDTSNNGWSGLIGGRWLVLPVGKGGLELNGGANYVDRVAGGQWGGILEARYHFLKALSVGLDYQFLEDEDRWGINARFSF